MGGNSGAAVGHPWQSLRCAKMMVIGFAHVDDCSMGQDGYH